MPYVEQKYRNRLDIGIERIVEDLARAVSDKNIEDFDSKDVLECSGNLNYVVTRICTAFLSGRVSYSKVAVLTGVLENVKQEFYRRVASPYEDKKIEENGDVSCYSKEEINSLHSL